jgi:hypothetical protein
MQDEVPEAPETIRTLADGCVRFVQQALGIALDGTPDTLPLLDHYLGLARDGEARSREEIIELVATAAGAYFGEVVRRKVPGARWHIEEEADPSTWRIELDHVFLCFNPVGMAREAITAQQEPGWNAHLELRLQDREVVTQALERVGPVDAGDYHRLAVRWEVIEQAVAVLEGAARARGEVGRRFSPDDYARALASRDEPPPS